MTVVDFCVFRSVRVCVYSDEFPHNKIERDDLWVFGYFSTVKWLKIVVYKLYCPIVIVVIFFSVVSWFNLKMCLPFFHILQVVYFFRGISLRRLKFMRSVVTSSSPNKLRVEWFSPQKPSCIWFVVMVNIHFRLLTNCSKWLRLFYGVDRVKFGQTYIHINECCICFAIDCCHRFFSRIKQNICD